jgi:K+-transporting ATPase c subunit
MNSEKLVKQKRKDALQGARDEQDLQNQLAAIERAAREAVQVDRLSSSASSFTPHVSPFFRLLLSVSTFW